VDVQVAHTGDEWDTVSWQPVEGAASELRSRAASKVSMAGSRWSPVSRDDDGFDARGGDSTALGWHSAAGLMAAHSEMDMWNPGGIRVAIWLHSVSSA